MAGAGIAINQYSALGNASISQQKEIRLGIIGLDTSHSPAFAKYINDEQKPSMQGVKVVAAYPYGSTKIESSASRIPEYTEDFKKMNIEIVDKLDRLIESVDGILLETNDGNLHLEQAKAVIRASKPLFIDKPVAAHLVDVLKIYHLANENNIPLFSASSLRYLAKAQEVRHANAVGDVTGADTFSPEKWEPSHSTLYWYGIHGVEILYTIMNTGCQRVRRMLTDNTDLVIGEWEGGRFGTFRGDLHGRQNYGGIAFGTKGELSVGPFDGYGALVEKIAEFFRTGKSPVADQETLELYTFMTAADVSKERNGEWVDMHEVYEKARAEAKI